MPPLRSSSSENEMVRGTPQLWKDFFVLIKERYRKLTYIYMIIYMGVSKNRATPQSSMLIGISILNHPFWGTTIFGNSHIYVIRNFLIYTLLSVF